MSFEHHVMSKCRMPTYFFPVLYHFAASRNFMYLCISQTVPFHFSPQAKRVNPLRRKINAVEPNGTWHWRLGLVVDNWLWGHEIPRLSPGCARSTLSPWKRIFTDISSYEVYVKRVPNCKKYARVTCHL